jgi:hypothetical protein
MSETCEERVLPGGATAADWLVCETTRRKKKFRHGNKRRRAFGWLGSLWY